jgi:(1->4)-alpha-D-glucan 1-alpha-D-glucosylmutase
VDPDGEAPLSAGVAQITGEPADAAAWERLVVECKRFIMYSEFASELQALALAAARIAQSDWRTRDLTLNGLREALVEVFAQYPVYRTYLRDTTPAEPQAPAIDGREIGRAVAVVRRAPRIADDAVLDFIEALLRGETPGRGAPGDPAPQAVRRFAMKAQQFSGPVTAKAVEDTAFYRFVRLLALNEVGAQPERFGRSVAAFHHAMAWNAQSQPAGLLATATHDTKRGEDARARLAVLSEMPDEWLQAVRGWSRLVRARRGDLGAEGPPSAADEYLFFQLLVSAWPSEWPAAPAPIEAEALESLTARLQAAMLKCLREAKLRTSWSHPDEAYESGAREFVAAALDLSRTNLFLEQFRAFHRDVARFGMVNSLAQLVLKLTAPGVPDLYQGTELWDLNLVDPDNRRPVDFALRERLLAALEGECDVAALLDAWSDGAIKLFVTQRLLQWRRARPATFADGRYSGLDATGVAAAHVVAFERRSDADQLLVMVPRLPARLARSAVGWGDTALALPAAGRSGQWRSLLDGQRHGAGDVAASRLFARLPVAVLVAD